MATSASINLAATRDDIITEALEHLGVLAEGESPSTAALTACSRTLNYMVKAWQGMLRGELWTINRVVLFPKKNQHEYSIKNGSSDKFCDFSEFGHTFLKSSAAASATSVSVDSITDISNGDNIGVEVEDNVMHWTTVNGAPSGNTVTLTAGLSTAASTDGQVYFYTTQGARPLRILEAYRRNQYDPEDDEVGTDIPIEILARRDYWNLSIKSTDGAITQIYYEPQIDENTAKLFTWPETSDETQHIVMYAQRTIEDFDAASDDADFPQEWFNALAWNLAMQLISKYGTSADRARYITHMAATSLFDAMNNDTEEYMRFQPDDRWQENRWR